MSGKGDTPRPMAVDRRTFAERWALAFGKQKTLTRPEPPKEEE